MPSLLTRMFQAVPHDATSADASAMIIYFFML